MGSGRWNPDDWDRHARTTASTKPTAAHVFTSHGIQPELDPRSVKMRESRDSAANPNSTAIIIGLDVTGSMGMLADTIARTGLGIVFQELIARQPVADPHLMIAAFDDIETSAPPLQVTQFEAEVDPMTTQIEKIFLSHNGGGNRYESSSLVHWFAAMHTSIDCFEKRGRKGYLFTVGDEGPTPMISAARMRTRFDNVPETDLTGSQMLDMARRQWHVFHVFINESTTWPRDEREIFKVQWRSILGERLLVLDDHKALAETIVSAIQVNEGADVKSVAGSWSGDKSVVVARALAGLPAAAGVGSAVERF